MGGGRQLRSGAGCHLAEGHHAGVAGLPDLRGDVEAVLADDRSRGASEGAVAREQGKALVALRYARFAVPVGAEDSLAPSPADTGAVGEAGTRSPGTGASAVSEGDAGVDERDSAGVNWGRKWGDYIAGPQNNSLSASPGATARIGERS